MARQKDRVLVAVGSRIRSLREARGIAQEDFAARAGLDRSYYGGVERGERNVAVRNLIRIAVALQVEPGELFPPLHDLGAREGEAGEDVEGDSSPDVLRQ